MAIGVVVLVVAGVFLVRSILGGSDYEGPGSAEAFGPSLGYYQTPQPTSTSVPPSEAPIASIRIPRFEVEAPIVALGVDGNGAMETPEGPWEVAWYDFTSRPGFGGNAVFSGHVDALYTGNPGPAVFFNLHEMNQGDVIEVELEDGTVYQYRVVSRWSVLAEDADIGSIVGKTQREVVTLITCGGEPGTSYDERLIVRAERAPGGAPASAAGAP